MNVDYSHVGVPATTAHEATEKEDHDHRTEFSEAHTLATQEAPAGLKVTTPTLVSPLLPSIAQNTTSWS